MSIQPYVLVLGDSLLEASQFFVILDDIVYEVETMIKAVDTCFKVFFVLNAQYPAMATEPWTFIQRAVFHIVTPYDKTTPRLIELFSFVQRK